MIAKIQNGRIKAIWDDHFPIRTALPGAMPGRASRVEVIPDGPHRGHFHVDFSLLADATGDERYRVCLTQTFERYSDAVAAEVAWLTKHYVLS